MFQQLNVNRAALAGLLAGGKPGRGELKGARANPPAGLGRLRYMAARGIMKVFPN